jgi:hypothetical protein
MTLPAPPAARMTLDRLAARKGVEIAVDTEFKDSLTLTVQAATRISRRRIAVQVYRSPAIPPFPKGFDPAASLPAEPERYGRRPKCIILCARTPPDTGTNGGQIGTGRYVPVPDELSAYVIHLHRAGWSIGDFASHDGAGDPDHSRIRRRAGHCEDRPAARGEGGWGREELHLRPR